MNVLFVASEVAPWSKTGGLGDVAGSLPGALAQRGHTLTVITPLYATVPRDGLERMDAFIRLRFPFGEERADLWVARPAPGLRVVFLDHPGYYGRPRLYGDARGDYPDNHRRFAFLSVGALATAQVLRLEPDIVHLHDWQTGLAAVALQRGYRGTALAGARSVFTIHNLAYQGLFPKWVMDDLGLPWNLFTAEGLEFHDGMSFMKAGLAWADVLTTVSERYAEEIQTPEYGCMLEGMLGRRRDRLFGILNGIDEAEWDPRRDRFLAARFGPEDLAGKTVCKAALRHELGLDGLRRISPRPLLAAVSRLAAQKGIDLLIEALPRLLLRDLEVVVLGSGERRYEDALGALAARFPDKLAVRIGFDHPLSHRMEAGADFFLMPSRYEPCGLNQMYSLRYGTLPVVRATGGLDDTVRDAAEPEGTGFKFAEYRADALERAVGRALVAWSRPEQMDAMRQRGMRAEFGWGLSARKYERLYATLDSPRSG